MSIAAETVDINYISAAGIKQVSDTFPYSLIESAVNFGSSPDGVIIPIDEQNHWNIRINNLLDIFVRKADGTDDYAVVTSADNIVYKLLRIPIATQGDDISQIIRIFFPIRLVAG